MKKITLLSKQDCELCEIAKNILLKLQLKISFDFETIDIESDPELYSKYKFKIPVLIFDGVEKFHSRISEKLILNELKCS